MQILITGGLGYVGSRLLEDLAGDRALNQAPITVVDNWAYGRGASAVLRYFAERLSRFRFRCLDVSDEGSQALRALVASSTHIVNCASLTGIPASPLHPRYIVGGAEVLSSAILDAAPRLEGIVELSSASVYGGLARLPSPPPEPYPETIPIDPALALHQYAESKVRAERLWAEAAKAGVPVTILRLSTAFGDAVGLRHDQFVNRFVVDAVAGRETVLPGAPADHRPFVHVADASAAIRAALFEGRAEPGTIVNVGAAELVADLGDLFARLSRVLAETCGARVCYRFAAESDRSALRESYRPDFARLGALLGITPRRGFEDGAAELAARLRGA